MHPCRQRARARWRMAGHAVIHRLRSEVGSCCALSLRLWWVAPCVCLAAAVCGVSSATDALPQGAFEDAAGKGTAAGGHVRRFRIRNREQPATLRCWSLACGGHAATQQCWPPSASAWTQPRRHQLQHPDGISYSSRSMACKRAGVLTGIAAACRRSAQRHLAAPGRGGSAGRGWARRRLSAGGHAAGQSLCTCALPPPTVSPACRRSQGSSALHPAPPAAVLDRLCSPLCLTVSASLSAGRHQRRPPGGAPAEHPDRRG